MASPLDDLVIPDKPVFRASEVCELLKLQPYVLRSWEKEFKDLGVARTEGGPRVYRREDIERAARIKHLMLVEGLTLAGVRRRFEEEQAAASVEETWLAEVAGQVARVARGATGSSEARAAGTAAGATVGEQAGRPGLSSEARARLAGVRDGLRELLASLSRDPQPGPAGPASGGARRGGGRGPGRSAVEAGAGASAGPSLFGDDALTEVSPEQAEAGMQAASGEGGAEEAGGPPRTAARPRRQGAGRSGRGLDPREGT